MGRKRNPGYVFRLYDQQGLRDVSGGSEGPGRLHDASGLARALAGLASRRIRRVRRDAGLSLVREILARYCEATRRRSRLAVCHTRPEYGEVLHIASKCNFVSHDACTE